MQIALLEDDLSQVELLTHWLRLAGHHAVAFQRGEDFLDAVRQQQFEVLILDWNLLEVTGIDILKRIRQTSKVPVLFCTSRDGQDDVVTALLEGADDYLVKPPRRLELLARIETVARRARKMQANAEAFEVSEFKLDCLDRIVSRAGIVIQLTVKDFDLAALFLRNIGRLLSRHRIYEAVWGANSKVTSRTIDTHVSRIRNKLGLMPSNGWHLKGVYGHGYRLEQVRSDARHEEAA